MKRKLLFLSTLAFCAISTLATGFEAVNDDGITLYYEITAPGEAAVANGGKDFNDRYYSGHITIPASWPTKAKPTRSRRSKTTPSLIADSYIR